MLQHGKVASGPACLDTSRGLAWLQNLSIPASHKISGRRAHIIITSRREYSFTDYIDCMEIRRSSGCLIQILRRRDGDLKMDGSPHDRMHLSIYYGQWPSISYILNQLCA